MIFNVTQGTCQDANDLIANADRLANRAYTILLIFAAIVDGIPNTLKSLKTAIQGLITLNDNVIRGLRNNPAIRGPYKIVATLFAGLLSGFGVVLDALKQAVVVLLNAMRGNTLKTLQKKVTELRQKLLVYFPISTNIDMLVSFLKDLSAWLEPNEPKIDPGDQVLYPLINSAQLTNMRGQMRKLTTILSDVNAEIDAIEDKVDEINNFLNSVNPIIALTVAVTNGINSVLGVFNQIFRRIKDLISSIPGIGWLLDSLDSLIDWALDKLGVRDLLNRAGAAFGNLPFFRAVRDFLRDLAAKVNDLIAKVQRLLDQIDEKIKELEKIKKEAAQVLAVFLSKNVPKNMHEIVLPESIIALLREAGGIEEAARPDEEHEAMPEETLTALVDRYDAFRRHVDTLITVNAITPELPFKRNYQSKFDAAMSKLMLERPRGYEETDTGLGFVAHVHTETVRTIKNLTALDTLYKEINPDRFSADYFQQGIRFYIQAQTDPILNNALYGADGAYANLGMFATDRTPQVQPKRFVIDDKKFTILDDVFPKTG